MRNIYGYTCSIALLLAGSLRLSGQDTLRTYGPRIGLDVARFAYYFADPSEIGAEISIDAEVYKDIYPVWEMGFSSHTGSYSSFDYASSGPYIRAGADYNLLPVADRSVHHVITAGLRYGFNRFTQRAENIALPGNYWGDRTLDLYEKKNSAHWFELAAGLKTEITANVFLGWSVRFKLLANPDAFGSLTPRLIPGYGNGTQNRAFGFSYSILYKIPLVKK